ncbi:MAG TPA: AbrB/MazE/SpoVT family DNA-binding domain-containing protein [Bdellovibrionota bacterium]|nr:AbrB/MazE/SpoVT family DNA-binding domain-containing protein [Bdellovibrionota bacterium]
MQVHVTKWGNSLGVRIPRGLANQVGLCEGTSVNISVQDHRILITKGMSLQALLENITPENLHGEVQTGSDYGKESW